MDNDEKKTFGSNGSNDVFKPSFALPDLEISSDTDGEDAEEVQPVVFHPALEQETSFIRCSTKTNVKQKGAFPYHEVTVNVQGNSFVQPAEKNEKGMCTKPYQYVELLPEEKSNVIDLTRALSEIELDNALINKPSCGSVYSQNSTGLEDSGSSNSSLLGKLESCMKVLKDNGDHNEIPILDEKVASAKYENPSLKFLVHESVARRYESTSSADIRDDIMEQRAKIKKESMDILDAQRQIDGKTPTESKEILDEVTSMETKKISSENGISLVECVDSMLDNVNSIIYQISDPGKSPSSNLIKRNGDVKKLYEFVNGNLDRKDKVSMNDMIPEERKFLEKDGIGDVRDAVNGFANEESLGSEKYFGVNSEISSSSKEQIGSTVHDSLFTNSFLSGGSSTQLVEISPFRVIKDTSKDNASSLRKVQSVSNCSDTYASERLDILRETESLKEEIRNDILNEKGNSQRLTRELIFENKETDEENAFIKSQKQSNISSCLACIQGECGETPLKHDAKLCSKKSTEKSVRSTGVSTVDLWDVQLDETSRETKQGSKPQKNASKSSKKRKKKKTKTVNQDIEESKENVEIKVSHENEQDTRTNKNEDLENKVNHIVKELKEITNQIVLLHHDVSFDVGYSYVPPSINKEILLLKIALESPGVLKTLSNESTNCLFDESSRNVYIGLVTLFIFLMQSNALKYQYASPEVPFDVVSLFQCFMDNEFYLIVGVCENEKTHQQKSKRTKLGSHFFHVVSQFLNSNTLEQLLLRISSNFNYGNASKLYYGKLSSIVNIIPDSGALQKLLSVKPSICINDNTRPLRNLSEYNLPSMTSVQPNDHELTCVTLECVNTMPPKTITSVLKNIYTQSLEIVGLRLGYVPQVNNPNVTRSVLAICIQDHKAASSEQGHLLFCQNPQLKDLNISFQSVDEKQLFSTPILRYTLNKNRAFKQVVRWFGPHFTGLEELLEYVDKMKCESKVDNSCIKNKKWNAVNTPSNLSLLCNVPMYAVVLVSSLVYSWFIPRIIKAANKKGMVLEGMSKNMVSTEFLASIGLSEASSRHYGHFTPVQKNTSCGLHENGSFTFLLFRGKSSVLRLSNLMENFAKYLCNGETLGIHQTFDNVQTLKALRNKKMRSFSFSNLQISDCFSVMHLNEYSSQLGKPYALAPPLQLKDFRDVIREKCCLPNDSLAAIVVCGQSFLSQLATILKLTFCGELYLDEALIGAKLIQNISSCEAHCLISEEPNTKTWRQHMKMLTGSGVFILVVKLHDFLRVSQLRTSLSSFVNASKVDGYHNGIIIHSDTHHIFDLMFMYFHPYELFQNVKIDSKLVTYAYMEKAHPFLTIYDKLYKLNLANLAVQKTISEVINGESCHFQNNVYQIHPQMLNYPCELLLRQQMSYCGLCIQLGNDDFVSIIKVIARVIRFGFRLAAWKFPVYRTKSYWLYVVFCRSDALHFMERVMVDIESNFQNLNIEVTKSLSDVIMFIKTNFCSNSYGGVFHKNYVSLLNQMNFSTDELIRSRERRSLEWNPLNSLPGRYSQHYGRTMMGDTSRVKEISVLIITAPLINGNFKGKAFPRSCTFPEMLQTYESINYHCLASRLTSLDEKDADGLLDVYGVEDKRRRHLLKSYMTSLAEPFMVVILIGVCIESNFWLEVERAHCEEEDVSILKKFSLASSTKKQVEVLVPTFFDHVLPNSKIEVNTSMVDLMAEKIKS